MTTANIIKKYGTPNETGEGYLIRINLPYPMRIAWDPAHTVSTMVCHRLVADKFVAVFNDLLSHYGMAKLKELGIDLFGGCFNFRKMRGGTEWSTHSWGIAIDINAAWNGLGKEPTMSNRLVKCFTDCGFEWGGTWTRKDGMHFQLRSI
jgi:hypothetical protein